MKLGGVRGAFPYWYEVKYEQSKFLPVKVYFILKIVYNKPLKRGNW